MSRAFIGAIVCAFLMMGAAQNPAVAQGLRDPRPRIDLGDTRACLKGRTASDIGIYGCDAVAPRQTP